MLKFVSQSPTFNISDGNQGFSGAELIFDGGCVMSGLVWVVTATTTGATVTVSCLVPGGPSGQSAVFGTLDLTNASNALSFVLPVFFLPFTPNFSMTVTGSDGQYGIAYAM